MNAHATAVGERRSVLEHIIGLYDPPLTTQPRDGRTECDSQVDAQGRLVIEDDHAVLASPPDPPGVLAGVESLVADTSGHAPPGGAGSKLA